MIDRNADEATAFEVTQVDTISHNYDDCGLLRLTVVERQYNSETDSKEFDGR